MVSTPEKVQNRLKMTQAQFDNVLANLSLEGITLTLFGIRQFMAISRRPPSEAQPKESAAYGFTASASRLGTGPISH